MPQNNLLAFDENKNYWDEDLFPWLCVCGSKKKKKKNSEKATSTLCCVQYKIIKYLNWQFYSCKGQ